MKPSTTISCDSLKFVPHEYGWRAKVPEEIGTFFKIPLSVDIATRHISTAPTTLPEIHDSQKQLVSSILARLRNILGEAEKSLDNWNNLSDTKFDEIVPRLADPRIWIRLADTENLRHPQPRNDREWTLVVGIEDAPDFGYHLEFDADNLLEVWAGD